MKREEHQFGALFFMDKIYSQKNACQFKIIFDICPIKMNTQIINIISIIVIAIQKQR